MVKVGEAKVNEKATFVSITKRNLIRFVTHYFKKILEILYFLILGVIFFWLIWTSLNRKFDILLSAFCFEMTKCISS